MGCGRQGREKTTSAPTWPTLETEIFSFSSIICVDAGEVDRHCRATISHDNLATCAAIADVLRSGKHWPQFDRPCPRRHRLQKLQAFVVGLGNGADRWSIAAEFGLIARAEHVAVMGGDFGKIAGRAEQVLGIFGPDAE